MFLVTKLTELTILLVFSSLFIAYSIFIYPVELASQLTDKDAKKKQMKYAPQI